MACSTCIKLRKAAFAVIKTVQPKPAQSSADARKDASTRVASSKK